MKYKHLDRNMKLVVIVIMNLLVFKLKIKIELFIVNPAPLYLLFNPIGAASVSLSMITKKHCEHQI